MLFKHNALRIATMCRRMDPYQYLRHFSWRAIFTPITWPRWRKYSRWAIVTPI